MKYRQSEKRVIYSETPSTLIDSFYPIDFTSLLFSPLVCVSSLGLTISLSLPLPLFNFFFQDMSENSGQQLLVKARFNFQQTNEDELTFTKGEIIGVTRQEEGGWWEGTLNGKTGWFPSNYVREVKGCGESRYCLWTAVQFL